MGMLRSRTVWGLFLLIAVISGVLAWHYRYPIVTEIRRWSLPETEPAAPDATRFAVIGDYGLPQGQWDVSSVIESWEPEFIATVGDNNYPVGSAETIDENIGQFYHDYISPYVGRYGKGASTNRFFPSPGHADWDSEDGLDPYLDYFTLPGNERYYDLLWGSVHLFLLDTDERDPDGATVESVQAEWLRQGLSASEAPWKLVLAHHAPYTSHTVEDIERMRWPFKEWGADAVLSGYFHVYERLEVDGLPYFVNGTGGSHVSGFGEIDPRSLFRYNEDYGAMIIDAEPERLTFRYVNEKGLLLDQLVLERDGP